MVLHAAVSLDGFLAGPDHDLSFLDDISHASEVYETFYAGVDALVMGRTTYDVVRELTPDWPYPGKPCTVVTSRSLARAPTEVSVDDGQHLSGTIARLRKHGRVWLVGGGALARTMLAADLLEEIDLVITPHVLGAGSSLWGHESARHALTLLSSTDLGAGAVRLRYAVRSAAAETADLSRRG